MISSEIRQDPRAEASSPYTAFVRLRALAESYPEEVLQNPVLPLLALEDPLESGRLLRCAREEVASRKIERLLVSSPGWLRWRFGCDCAERVVGLLDEELRRQAERVLAAMRVIARPQPLPLAAYNDVAQALAAFRGTEGKPYPHAQRAAYYAVRKAGDRLSEAGRRAAEAAYRAVFFSGGDVTGEREWQAAHLADLVEKGGVGA